jgi:lysophospholipase L1-like esterase
MNKIKFKHKKRLLFVISIGLSCLSYSIFLNFYLSRINIYGDYRVEVFQDSTNVTSKANCYGISVFGSKTHLDNNNKYFKSNKEWYLKKLEISFTDSANNNKLTQILVYDIKNNVLKDTSIVSTGLLEIEHININENNIDKISVIGFELFKAKTVKYSLLAFLAALLVLIILFVSEDKILSINSILKIIIAFNFIAFLYQAYVMDKILLSTGIFLQISIFMLIVLLFNKYLTIDLKKKQNILTVIGTIFIMIIVIESTLRLFEINKTNFEERFKYYESIYSQNKIRQDFSRAPNSKVYFVNTEFNFERNTNSLGLSDKEPTLLKENEDFLIIGIGDSFTEGDGTHADSTWLKFLEKKMPKSDSINYRFLNAGICGSDPYYEYKLLKDKLLVYKPNLVIVAYGYELTDIVLRGGMERFETNKLKIREPIWEKIYSVSFIFRLVIHNLFNYNDLLLSPTEFKTEQNRAIEQLKESLILFKNLSIENNFDLLIVFYPQKQEVIDRKFTFNGELIKFADANSIKNLNLLEYYLNIEKLNKDNVSDYYWQVDSHHNSKGYGLFANGVKWKLEQLGH